MTMKDCINTACTKKYVDEKLSSYSTTTEMDTAIDTALADYSTTTEMDTAIDTAIDTALADYSTTSEMNSAIADAIADIPVGSGSTIHKIIFESVQQFNSLLPNFYDSENEEFTKDVVIVSNGSESQEFYHIEKGTYMTDSLMVFWNLNTISPADVGTSDYDLMIIQTRVTIPDLFFSNSNMIQVTNYYCHIGTSSTETESIPRFLFTIYYIDDVVEHGSLNSDSGSDDSGNNDSGDGDNGR